MGDRAQGRRNPGRAPGPVRGRRPWGASFGGVNFIEFRSETDVVVNPLRVEPTILSELEYNMLLVYTGATRVSAKIIESQIAGLTEKRSGVTAAMDEMKRLTIDA